ncbi:glucuronosyltransferase [Sphingobium sp.]|uniref:glucuronosyltransferase n=1 Tax=Sphingobium sp. TaxID=1912891 RepID=UPI003BB6CB9E
MPITPVEPGRSTLKTVLAVASKGGHWEQLLLMRPTLDQFDTVYATTGAGYAARDGLNVHVLPDANRFSGIGVVQCYLAARKLVQTVRPDVVISTGAMPGLFCLIAARRIGARTIWIDSIANSENSSFSGKLARWCATLWLTQWEHLAKPGGPHYRGAVF